MKTSNPVGRRRRHHTSEFKQGLVALCQPGVSVSSVALAHGINTNLLRHWIGLYRNELPAYVSSDYSKLVAVQVDPAPWRWLSRKVFQRWSLGGFGFLVLLRFSTLRTVVSEIGTFICLLTKAGYALRAVALIVCLDVEDDLLN